MDDDRPDASERALLRLAGFQLEEPLGDGQNGLVWRARRLRPSGSPADPARHAHTHAASPSAAPAAHHHASASASASAAAAPDDVVAIKLAHRPAAAVAGSAVTAAPIGAGSDSSRTVSAGSIPSGSQLAEDGAVLVHLRHPNIAELLCVLESPPALVLHYCSGGALIDWLQAGGAVRLTAVSLVDVAEQLAGALHYLHSNEILHLDLSLDNILVDDTPVGLRAGAVYWTRELQQQRPDDPRLLTIAPQIKVADFGISRMRQSDARVLKHYRSQTVVSMADEGFSDWLPPESDISTAFDMYLLGVALRCIVEQVVWAHQTRRSGETGEAPVQPAQCLPWRAPVNDSADKHAHAYAERKSEQVLSALDSIVKCCMQQDPGARPSAGDVSAFFRYLAVLAVSEPSHAAPLDAFLRSISSPHADAHGIPHLSAGAAAAASSSSSSSSASPAPSAHGAPSASVSGPVSLHQVDVSLRSEALSCMAQLLAEPTNGLSCHRRAIARLTEIGTIEQAADLLWWCRAEGMDAISKEWDNETNASADGGPCQRDKFQLCISFREFVRRPLDHNSKREAHRKQLASLTVGDAHSFPLSSPSLRGSISSVSSALAAIDLQVATRLANPFTRCLLHCIGRRWSGPCQHVLHDFRTHAFMHQWHDEFANLRSPCRHGTTYACAQYQQTQLLGACFLHMDPRLFTRAPMFNEDGTGAVAASNWLASVPYRHLLPLLCTLRTDQLLFSPLSARLTSRLLWQPTTADPPSTSAPALSSVEASNVNLVCSVFQMARAKTIQQLVHLAITGRSGSQRLSDLEQCFSRIHQLKLWFHSGSVLGARPQFEWEHPSRQLKIMLDVLWMQMSDSPNAIARFPRQWTSALRQVLREGRGSNEAVAASQILVMLYSASELAQMLEGKQLADACQLDSLPAHLSPMSLGDLPASVALGRGHGPASSSASSVSTSSASASESLFGPLPANPAGWHPNMLLATLHQYLQTAGRQLSLPLSTELDPQLRPQLLSFLESALAQGLVHQPTVMSCLLLTLMRLSAANQLRRWSTPRHLYLQVADIALNQGYECWHFDYSCVVAVMTEDEYRASWNCLQVDTPMPDLCDLPLVRPDQPPSCDIVVEQFGRQPGCKNLLSWPPPPLAESISKLQAKNCFAAVPALLVDALWREWLSLSRRNANRGSLSDRLTWSRVVAELEAAVRLELLCSPLASPCVNDDFEVVSFVRVAFLELALDRPEGDPRGPRLDDAQQEQLLTHALGWLTHAPFVATETEVENLFCRWPKFRQHLEETFWDQPHRLLPSLAPLLAAVLRASYESAPPPGAADWKDDVLLYPPTTADDSEWNCFSLAPNATTDASAPQSDGGRAYPIAPPWVLSLLPLQLSIIRGASDLATASEQEPWVTLHAHDALLLYAAALAAVFRTAHPSAASPIMEAHADRRTDATSHTDACPVQPLPPTIFQHMRLQCHSLMHACGLFRRLSASALLRLLEQCAPLRGDDLWKDLLQQLQDNNQ